MIVIALEYHNAFPGGYVEHVIRVVNAALEINKVWVNFEVDSSTYTIEELVFSALNHDLGKMLVIFLSWEMKYEFQ